MQALFDFAERGPHRVGVRTASLRPDPDSERRIETDLWYPSDDAQGQESAPHPFGQPHAAIPDAAARAGPHPLVVFSHGNAGTRRQSTFLTTHLASWGIAVVAPDHSGNTFTEMAALRSDEERRSVHFAVRRERPRDALAAVDAALDGGFAEVAIDAQRIAALGHSFGGWTTTKLPRRDARIRAVAALAPAAEAFVGRKAYEPGELPFAREIPTLVVAALDDALIDFETSIRPLFARLGPAAALVGIDGADHFHFCDGIPLLHAQHEANPRANQLRATRPYAETVDEARMHRLLRTLLTFFFVRSFAGASEPIAELDTAALVGLDPSLRRL